ncbi:MAG: carboxypeptidase-like regulatory domain-containing protein, partial [Gillisia sp.]
MRKFYFVPLFCTLLFISFPSFSQNSLQGIIVNQKKEPVAFANVVLLQAKDSVSVVKGVVSEEDGSFLLNDIADSNYVLQVSFVGYENYLKKIKVKGNE